MKMEKTERKQMQANEIEQLRRLRNFLTEVYNYLLIKEIQNN